VQVGQAPGYRAVGGCIRCRRWGNFVDEYKAAVVTCDQTVSWCRSIISHISPTNCSGGSRCWTYLVSVGQDEHGPQSARLLHGRSAIWTRPIGVIAHCKYSSLQSTPPNKRFTHPSILCCRWRRPLNCVAIQPHRISSRSAALQALTAQLLLREKCESHERDNTRLRLLPCKCWR
jgi:hypothetical protein